MHKFWGEMLWILFQCFVVFFYYFAYNLPPCLTHFPAGLFGQRFPCTPLTHFPADLFRFWFTDFPAFFFWMFSHLYFSHWFSCVLLDFRTFSSVLHAFSGGFPESVSALYWPRLISYEYLQILFFPFAHLRFSSGISSDAIIKHTYFHQASATHECGNMPFAYHICLLLSK